MTPDRPTGPATLRAALERIIQAAEEYVLNRGPEREDLLIRAVWEGKRAALAAPAADGLDVERRLRAAIAHAGYEFRDPCDACDGVPDPREPDVICAWCGGVGGRLISAEPSREPGEEG